MEPATPHGNLALDAAADTPTLFGQTMGLVAATTGLFALGAYLGRNLSDGWGWVAFIGAFLCLVAMRLAVRAGNGSVVGLLFGFGILMSVHVHRQVEIPRHSGGII